MRRHLVLAPFALLLAAGCSGGSSGSHNQVPQAAFDGPASVRVNTAATFDGGSSADGDGSVTDWDFDFGDGSAHATGASLVAHTYAATGSYTVKLVVTDDKGATSSVSRGVTVTANQPPVAEMVLPASARIHVPALFSATASDDVAGTLTWAWSWGDGSNGATAAQASHVFATPGTFTVTVTATDADGGAGTASATVFVADDLPPLASFTAPATALVGQTVSLDSAASSDPDGSIASRAWDFGDGATSTLASPVHAWTAAGVKTVSLTVTDDEGKTAAFSRQVTVQTQSQTQNPPSATFTAPASVREDRLASFDASASSGSGALAFAWTFGDGGTGVGTGVSHTYAAPGTYVVTLTVTATFADGSTLASAAQRSITVTPNTPPVAALTGPTSLRVNRTATFDASASYDSDGAVASWAFDFGDGATSGASLSPVRSHVYAAPGTYIVVVTAMDGDGATATASRMVEITPNLAPQAALVASASVHAHEVATFDASGSADPDGAIASYAFDFGDGATFASGSPNAAHAYASAGNYLSTVTVSDGEGGSASASAVVVVTNDPPVASLQLPVPARAGRSYVIDGSTSTDPDGSVTAWSFSFGDGTVTSGAASSVAHAWAASGVYTVSLAVTDDAGQTSTTTRTLVVSPNQLPIASFTGPTEAVVNDVLSFDASASADVDGAIVGYSWAFGDGTTATGPSVTHAYASSGSRNVTLTVTDDDGGTAVSTRTVSVLTAAAVGDPPIAVLDLPSEAMVNDPQFFDGSRSSGGSGMISQYAFDFGDGTPVLVSTSANAVAHAYSAPGTYTARLTITSTYSPDDSTRSNTAARQIVVQTNVVTLASVNPPTGPRTGGQTVLLTGTAFTSPGDTTVWFGANQAAIVAVLDPQHLTVQVPAGDPGPVAVTVRDSNGLASLPAGYGYDGAGNEPSTNFCFNTNSATQVLFPNGNNVVLDDDNTAAPPLPFDFAFFDQVFPAGTQPRASVNGWMSMTDTSNAFDDQPLPSTADPVNLIAPYFFDQLMYQPGNGLYSRVEPGTAPNRRYTLEWSCPYSKQTQQSCFGYQVTLFEGSDDIKFTYINNDITDPDANGSKALIGIQDATATRSVTFSHDTAQGGIAPGGRTVVFKERNGVYSAFSDTTLSVTASDLTPSYYGTPTKAMVTYFSTFYLQFSRPVATNTVNSSSVQIRDASNNPVSIESITFNPAKDRAIVRIGDPFPGLVPGGVYTVTVTGGVHDVLGRSLAQNPFAQNCGANGTSNYVGKFRGAFGQVAQLTLPAFGQVTRLTTEAPSQNRVFAVAQSALFEMSVPNRTVLSITTSFGAGQNYLQDVAVKDGDRVFFSNWYNPTFNDNGITSLKINVPGAPASPVFLSQFSKASTYPTAVSFDPNSFLVQLLSGGYYDATARINVAVDPMAQCTSGTSSDGTFRLPNLPNTMPAGMAAWRTYTGQYVAVDQKFLYVVAPSNCASGTDAIVTSTALPANANATQVVANYYKAFVLFEGLQQVGVYNLDPGNQTYAQGQLETMLPLPGSSVAHGMALSQDFQRLYVMTWFNYGGNFNRDAIRVFDVYPYSQTDNTPIDIDNDPSNGPTPIALPLSCGTWGLTEVNTATGRELWAGCYYNQTVQVLHPVSGLPQ